MGKRIAFVVAAVLLGLSGCGQAAVDKQELAVKIGDQLQQQAGRRPDMVMCPDDLPAEVGRSLRCELMTGRNRLGVTATVTEVVGADVRFRIEVDVR